MSLGDQEGFYPGSYMGSLSKVCEKDHSLS